LCDEFASFSTVREYWNYNDIDKFVISDISYLIGISHDFGKYATFFQEKLKGQSHKEISF
jgi:hypothetical protein